MQYAVPPGPPRCGGHCWHTSVATHGGDRAPARARRWRAGACAVGVVLSAGAARRLADVPAVWDEHAGPVQHARNGLRVLPGRVQHEPRTRIWLQQWAHVCVQCRLGAFQRACHALWRAQRARYPAAHPGRTAAADRHERVCDWDCASAPERGRAIPVRILCAAPGHRVRVRGGRVLLPERGNGDGRQARRPRQVCRPGVQRAGYPGCAG